MNLAPLRFMCVLAALLVGCSPSFDGENPRVVAERLVTARNNANIPMFLSTLPPAAVLGRHLDCDANHSLQDALRRTQEDAPASLPLWRQSGIQSKIIRFDEENAEIEVLSPGDLLRDCVVLIPVEIKRINVRLLNKMGGQSEEAREQWSFWRFQEDLRWYYARF